MANADRTRDEQMSEPAKGSKLAADTSRAVQLSAKLRGSSYADQVALLAPDNASRAPVQAAGGSLGGDVHAIAASGMRGSGQTLPHREAIQQSFGGHDVSRISAHVGGAAATASKAIGAEAYASSGAVAFKRSPDLHTAAHEAAHVVQQRAGVQLKGGVGQVGDTYERHADAVAERVVAGRSAVQLLDQFAPGGADASIAVQQRQTVQCKDYEGTTVGVEQEMTGHKIMIPQTKDRGVQGWVKLAGDLLIEFTSDMGSDGEYTIELRSTPTEAADDDAITARKEATEVMIAAIVDAGKEREGVKSQQRGKYKITIVQPRHRIELDRGGFCNQASLGVQTDGMADGSEDGALILKYAAWYDPGLAAKIPAMGLENQDKGAAIYAMLQSTINFLADIVRGYGPKALDNGEIAINIFEPKIKDKWAVLPRTPPWDWLGVLSANDRSYVADYIKASSQADAFSQAAYGHMLAKRALAGHKVPESTIAGEHASVFEFRSVPHELKKYLYGEEAIPEEVVRKHDPKLVKTLMAAKHMRRRAEESDSEDEDSEEWMN